MTHAEQTEHPMPERRTPAASHPSTKGMKAMPADGCDPHDPVQILAALPTRYHQQFLTDYQTALTDARQPEEYRKLRHALRLWRQRALAYSDPAALCAPPAPVPHRPATAGGNTTPAQSS